MSNIIPLPGDRHLETHKQLAWYVNGTLDEAERSQVEAHLATCAECRAELASERRLKQAVAQEAPAPSAAAGWAAMRERIAAQPAPVASAPMPERPRRAPLHLGWTAWVISAQAAAIVLMAGFILHAQLGSNAPYHTLGSAHVTTGNVVVLFRPDSSEAQIRRTLQSADARLVDGPTDAGAYILHVEPAQRDAALSRLQDASIVTLAQPIDGTSAP